MSRRESETEYIDTMSSGDSNNTKSKQTPKAKEVNNNEVDELSKEFSEMGCIVDAIKRPPNICVETCVYESDTETPRVNDADVQNEEDAYSDEFEEEDEDSVATELKSSKTDSRDPEANPSSVKLSKSQSSVCSNKAPASISGRSGRSTDYGLVKKLVPRHISVEWRCGVFGCQYHNGAPLKEHSEQWTERCSMPSVSVPSTRRTNMSFSNDRLREIERHNHILLTKILSARNTRKSSIPSREQPLRRPLPSAAVMRKNHQRQIDHDNMILLKKIQRAKSSAYNVRR